MQNNRLTVLAINPGTRYIGIAVLKGTVLLDWSVKVVSGKLSTAKYQKMAILIDCLIEEYEPDVIALKRLHSSRSSNVLNRFCRYVETTAAKDIKLVRHSIGEIEAFFVPSKPINKMELAQLLCRQHPVLNRELEKERNNYNPYHIRMFEAVGLATMAEATMHNVKVCVTVTQHDS